MNQNPKSQKQWPASFVPLPMRQPAITLDQLTHNRPPVQVTVISDVAPPSRSPTAGTQPPTSISDSFVEHKQYNRPLTAQTPPQRLSVAQARPPSPAPAHHIPVNVAHSAPAPRTPAANVVIRLTIPNPRKIKLPVFVKEYKAFWWILVIFGLLIFTIGYIIGHHSHVAVPVPPAAVMHQLLGQGVNHG